MKQTRASLLHCTHIHAPRRTRMTLVHPFWLLRRVHTAHWRISWLFHLHVFGMPWVPAKHNNDARLMWKNEYDVHECVCVKWNYAVTYDFIRRFTGNRTQFPSPNCVLRERATWRHRHGEREIFLWIQMRFKTKLYCVKVHLSETSDLLTSKRHGENGGREIERKGPKMTTINVTENLQNLLWENVRVVIHCMHKSAILFV